MTLTREELADRLYALACSDFAEPDPTTGEAFNADGRLIVEASIRLRSLAAEAQEWDKDYDQNVLCQCGHPYYRHFDTYDEMAAVGCKYCGCSTFKPVTPSPVRSSTGEADCPKCKRPMSEHLRATTTTHPEPAKPSLDDEVVRRLEHLTHPLAEAMSDKARIDAFVSAGIDAIALIERLVRENERVGLLDERHRTDLDKIADLRATISTLQQANEAQGRKIERLRAAIEKAINDLNEGLHSFPMNDLRAILHQSESDNG